MNSEERMNPVTMTTFIAVTMTTISPSRAGIQIETYSFKPYVLPAELQCLAQNHIIRLNNKMLMVLFLHSDVSFAPYLNPLPDHKFQTLPN